MELIPMKNGIDRCAKKEELFLSKYQQVIDELIQEMQEAISKIQSDQSQSIPTIMQQLGAKMNQISSSQPQLEIKRKDLNRSLTNYSKLLNTCFEPDISTAYRNIEMDTNTINQTILTHFYRQGLFELGDIFLCESSGDTETAAGIRSTYSEIHGILQSIKNRKFEPALTWVAANRDKFTINKKFLRNSVRNQELEDLLHWAQRLEESHVSYLLSSIFIVKIGQKVMEIFWKVKHIPQRCPLKTTIEAGIEALPTLLKLMKNVFQGKEEEWEKLRELPIPVELGRKFQFRSIFVCPVIREVATEENPPMMLNCGHVLSKAAVKELAQAHRSHRSHNLPCPHPHCHKLPRLAKRLYF